jgi:hypothetical protein
MLEGVEGSWREAGLLGIKLGRSGTAAAVQLLLLCLRTLKCWMPYCQDCGVAQF